MFTIKVLEELNVYELRRELRVRKLDPKGKTEELMERLETWIIDNGYEVDEYGFEDHGYIKLMARLGDDLTEQQQRVMNFLAEEEIRIQKLKSATRKPIKESLIPEMELQEKITEVSFDKAATSCQPEETPTSTKNNMPAETSAMHPITTMVPVEETEKIVDGRTLGSKVFLPWSEELGKELREKLGEENGAEETFAEIGEGSFVVDGGSPIVELPINVGNEDNGELKEILANSKEVTSVPDESVPRTIASLVSVVERTEGIIEGGTLGETRVEPPRVEESVEKLDPENSGERFELEVAEFDSVVDVTEIGAAVVIADESGDVGGEVLGDNEYVVGNVGSMSEKCICGVLSQGGLSGLRRSSETQGEPLVLLFVLLIFFSKRFYVDTGGGRACIDTIMVVHKHHVRDCVPRVKMKVAHIRRLAKYHGEQLVRDEQI